MVHGSQRAPEFSAPFKYWTGDGGSSRHLAPYTLHHGPRTLEVNEHVERRDPVRVDRRTCRAAAGARAICRIHRLPKLRKRPDRERPSAQPGRALVPLPGVRRSVAVVDGPLGSDMSETMRVGWIGTGVMGLSMCGHLKAKGHPITIYSRTTSQAQPLLDKGAAWADTPAGVADASDVIFTIVGLPSDVREVYLRRDGILDAVKRGSDHRRHDDDRAQPVARDLRRGKGERRGRD